MLDAVYRNVLLPPIRRITSNDAETAHEWFLSAMRVTEKRALLRNALAAGFEPDECLGQTLLDGLVFPTPFGVAAGLDKNATIFHSVQALTAAGFVEIGTVTPRPQQGNPRPRIVRVGKDNLINALGFPNDGIEAVVQRLADAKRLPVPLGLNIGKMRDTNEDGAAEDYAELIRSTARLRYERQLPDYYVINVSSPNTPGLTSFQKIEPLTAIVTAVVEALDTLADPEVNLRHRLLIKLGADIEPVDIEPIVDLVVQLDIGGLITTNTTTTRPVSSKHDARPGGFSGSSLFDKSAGVIRQTAQLLPRSKVLVATGGIDTVDRAYEMLRYADLIGGYTGLVLQGPHLFRRLSRGVAQRMRAAGIKTLAELRHDQRPQ